MTVKRWFLYAFAIAAFCAGTAVGWANGELRARDGARDNLAHAESAYQYHFLRGIYATCLLFYDDVLACRELVAGAIQYDVYHDPRYTYGFEIPK